MKQRILKGAKHGMKVVSFVKKCELSQSMISMIVKSGDSVMKRDGTGGHADERKQVREPF